MKAALILGTLVLTLVAIGFGLGVRVSEALPSYHGACLQVTDSTKLCLVQAD